MSPVATETPTPGWGIGPTPAYTVIYTGKLHHDRGRYPEALADAVIDVAGALSFISFEERLLVASKVDPVGFARQVQALASYAKQFDYISPHDILAGDALETIKRL